MRYFALIYKFRYSSKIVIVRNNDPFSSCEKVTHVINARPSLGMGLDIPSSTQQGREIEVHDVKVYIPKLETGIGRRKIRI